jgi:endo-1,4-beta-D-glucanase Y
MKFKGFKIIFVFIIVIIILIGINGFIINKKENTSKDADDSYKYWKQNYVVNVNSNMNRVVDPQNNNITVSEGMGYGLLFAATSDDSREFEKLWNYTNSYLDENGLMNWKIDSNGEVSGVGSATDADEDIAYALLLASKKWTQTTYLKDANKMIKAIKNNEISKDYVLLPGDKWGKNQPFNPSYVSPSYYLDFGALSTSEKTYWEKVSNANLQLLNKSVNEKTGLFPDWINKDGSAEDEDNKFGYDAIRVPLRLIEFYKRTNNPIAKKILEKENAFLSSLDSSKVVAGYSASGEPLVKYINTEYLSSYTAISLINEGSNFNKSITAKLRNSKGNSYYGCSLKTWVLFIMDERLGI